MRHTPHIFALILLASSSFHCSSDDESTAPSSAAPPRREYAAVVRGRLAHASDLAKAKEAHDQVAKGGEAQSKAAGDFAHDALLGTTMLDSIENEFLAIDRWNDAASMKAFYADPNVQRGFGALFASPPSFEFFELAPDWVSWGDMASGDAFNPYFFHLALGTLRGSDAAASKSAHDQVASGGKDPSLAAGNVAHVVFVGLDDKRRFVAVDIWKNGAAIQGFYTSPAFRAAFEPLFESVKEPVYRSTDWHQW
jgi:quinol monooxygenase YgiN